MSELLKLLHRGMEIARTQAGHVKSAEYLQWEKDLGVTG